MASMCQIAGTVGDIHKGMEEISAASTDLSRRTEQQAQALEETAAVLHELTTTVQRTSKVQLWPTVRPPAPRKR